MYFSDLERQMEISMNKPYNDLNTYLQNRFGCKVFKLSLSTGCSCPNRDGNIGTGGCIFCSEGGSGDFAAPSYLSVTDQIEFAKRQIASKIDKKVNEKVKYIAYFQSYTNTYGPVDRLRAMFTEAINNEEICALSIATRPDCITNECIEMLLKLNRIKPVWIELGLQTIHEKTAEAIHRGYHLNAFEDAVRRLNRAGLEIIVHVILGLPGETEEMMLDTIRYISNPKLKLQGVKLQLLHVLKGTELGRMFNEELKNVQNSVKDIADKDSLSKEEKEYIRADITAQHLGLHIRTADEYINLLACCLKILPSEMVIHRLTGDAPRDLLIYPKWSTNKKIILNGINATKE